MLSAGMQTLQSRMMPANEMKDMCTAALDLLKLHGIRDEMSTRDAGV
jgi:hypothetical protein